MLVVIVAVFFAGMGVYALAAPQALIRPFRIKLEGGEARTEIRAVYGGFGLAIAGLLGWAATEPAEHDGILITVAVAVFGMAAGRLIGRVFDRPKSFYPTWFYFWVEVVAGTLLLVR
jgi:hypothetical protein